MDSYFAGNQKQNHKKEDSTKRTHNRDVNAEDAV